MSGWTAEITISLQFGGMREGVLRSGPALEMIEGGGGDGASSIGESSSGVSCGSSDFLNNSAAGSHECEGHHQFPSRFEAGAQTSTPPSSSPSSRIGFPCEHHQGNQRHMNPRVAQVPLPANRAAYDQEWYNKRRGIALLSQQDSPQTQEQEWYNKRHGIALPKQDLPQTQDSWQQIAKELRNREVKEPVRSRPKPVDQGQGTSYQSHVDPEANYSYNMGERSVCNSHAAVMVYDNEAKKWQNAGGSPGISRVQIYFNPQNDSYRVVGRMVSDNTVSIPITKFVGNARWGIF
ncbi:uncharacterized protein LOC135154727 [Lytechinus pictus]|uniref:uncharacterized protein LOC135154727 n=1 Tax=Lytechinus pictus TaxID=7653 RepID=UPI0030B9E15E